MIKAAVTGATGFLGFRLSKRLKTLGYDVIALGRNKEKGRKLEDSGIKFIQVDLSEKDVIDKILKNVDYVFHCAAKSSVWGDYESFYVPNVHGTKNITDSCIKNNVKRLIYVSSPSIYFEYKDKTDIKESELPSKNPANNYIKTKIEAEKIIDDAFMRGLDVITVRPRGIFGSGDASLLPRLFRANKEKFIPKTRKGDVKIDITHVDNVVEALICAMNADKKYSGEKYNITNGENIYLYDTLKRVFENSGVKFNSKYIPYNILFAVVSLSEFIHKYLIRSEPVFTTYSLALLSFNQTLDISKAKTELGYKPVISISDGLKECINGRI